MKKMLWIAAIAFAMVSCGNKPAEQAEEAAEEAPAVEVVEEAPAAPAPKCEAKEEPKAEEAPAQEKEKSLIQRAVELGEDVAKEVEKNK